MKQVTATFLRGLFTLLPLLFSLYVIVWFYNFTESYARSVLLAFLPEVLYFPGLGIAIAVAVIYLFGLVVDRPLTRTAFGLIESLFNEVPVIKTVYTAIKDFTEYLTPSGGRRANQVVLVRFPGVPVEMVGLMTRENLRDLPSEVTKEQRVAVYFPMSYQFGGATVFLPREWVHPTPLSVEEAMRSIITAWLPGKDKHLEKM